MKNGHPALGGNAHRELPQQAFYLLDDSLHLVADEEYVQPFKNAPGNVLPAPLIVPAALDHFAVDAGFPAVRQKRFSGFVHVNSFLFGHMFVPFGKSECTGSGQLALLATAKGGSRRVPCRVKAEHTARPFYGPPCETLIRAGWRLQCKELSKASGGLVVLAFGTAAQPAVDRLERTRPTGTQRERRWIGCLERAD
jgi:hypothetical protein